MLAPLLVLWPMSVTLTFVVAQEIANPPFDRKLEETASLLADHVDFARARCGWTWASTSPRCCDRTPP